MTLVAGLRMHIIIRHISFHVDFHYSYYYAALFAKSQQQQQQRLERKMAYNVLACSLIAFRQQWICSYTLFTLVLHFI